MIFSDLELDTNAVCSSCKVMNCRRTFPEMKMCTEYGLLYSLNPVRFEQKSVKRSDKVAS